MLRALLFASLLAGPTTAQSLPEGAFAGETGGQLIDITFGPGQDFSIAVNVPESCTGGGAGKFEKVTPGMYRAVIQDYEGPFCELHITENRRGFNITQSGGDCGHYSGTDCGFYGTATK